MPRDWFCLFAWVLTVFVWIHLGSDSLLSVLSGKSSR
jgi:hypothetical protein